MGSVYMRKPEDMAWYAVQGPDGQPRACHCVKSTPPENGKEITQQEAALISKDVRDREEAKTS